MGNISTKKKNKNTSELRLKNPTRNIFRFVATLADENRRSIPMQMQVIFEEYRKMHEKKENK